MRKNLILSICFCLVSCSSSSAQEEIPDGDKTSYYWNPVIDYSLPDPTIIEGGDGYYYCMQPKIFVICRSIVPRI